MDTETRVKANEINSFLPNYLRSIPLSQSQTDAIQRMDYGALEMSTHPDAISFLVDDGLAFSMYEMHEEEIRLRSESARSHVQHLDERVRVDYRKPLRQAATDLLRDLALWDYARAMQDVQAAKREKRRLEAERTGPTGDGATL